jgi:membrane fusion protein, multidrug efflux system
MKKSWIIILLVVAVIAGAFYRLSSNKSAMEAELAARKRTVLVVPVTVTEISRGSVARTFSVDGVLSAKDQVTILSETSGQVQAVYHDVGDFVQAGTPLALVDAHVLTTQLDMAKTSLANNERDLARFENLLKSGAASQQTVDNLKLAVESARSTVVSLEKQVANTTVKSPLRGNITARNVEKGSVLGGGSPTFTVADLSAMTMKVGLTESEVSGVRAGMAATVHVDALGKDFAATVTTVGVTADLSGRYNVEVQLKNFAKGELRPDLSGTVAFTLAALENKPVVPRKALVAGVKDPKVFVIKDNKAVLRPITPALINGSDIVVGAGLEEGDQVVLTGQMNLVDGTPVKVMQ